MAKLLKKHSFPLRIERFFTREDRDAFDLIHFRESEAGDTTLETPGNWSAEAAATLAEQSVAPSIPAATRSIEENTVPSWLWRRVGENRLRASENSARQIFHRTAGATTYAGWKQGVFADESETRAFFDEARYMLAQRFIALEPRLLAALGLDWAYGIERKAAPAPRAAAPKIKPVDIHNASIDALLGGRKNARGQWQKILTEGIKAGALAVRFADIASDWDTGVPHQAATRAAIDLLAFRREDGAIDAARLGHAVKLLVILLELQHDRAGGSIAIGFHNLAPLLMSQGLPYDSDAGRAAAASLAAIVTAEAYAASAQLAALLGPSLDFAADRESILRALRNHRRAAYGDRADYEKISVLPAPLTLEAGADLALIAAARRRWDETLDLVRQHGLRFIRMTDLSPVPELTFFMECAAEGIAPLPALTTARATDADIYQRVLHPAIAEGLARLGYNAETRKALAAHIAGTGTLGHAPAIDHAALRRHDFDDAALEKIEHYLSYVNDIRLAFTPWILGEDFCRDTLKLPADKIESPAFDLLRHLGFTAAEIETANAFVYGRGTIHGAKGLKPAHASVFAAADDIPPEARIRMAAAVQGFLSGDAGLRLPLAAAEGDNERLLLGAWRQGIKSIEIAWRAPENADQPTAARASKAPQTPSTLPNYKAPLHSALGGRAKAQAKLVSINQKGTPPESRKKRD